MCSKVNWIVEYKFIVWFKSSLLALAKSIYQARSTDFEEKIEGLWKD